jgi:signal transduction histidine kinase
VGSRDEEGTLTKENLRSLAAEADLLAIVLYDAHGEAIYESAPVPENLSPRIKLMLESRDEIALDLHGEGAGGNFSYLVGVHRRNAKGMIVLVLGDEGLQYWASRVAIQEAVEEGGWRKGVHYFAVVDSKGRLLAGAGDLPEMDDGKGMSSKDEENRLQNGRPSRRIIKDSPELLEVYAPLLLNGREAGIARVGLEIEEVGRLKKRNEAHILFSMALMMAGAVLAVLVFYRIQNRHQRKLQEMRERLHQAERLSSLGRLAAGVAHEIRNPLNAISMAIQRIHREFGPPETEKNKEFSHLVTVVREEIRRLNGIIEDFVGPARERRTDFRPERLIDLLERVVQLAKEEIGSRNIQIQSEWEDPNLIVYMDSGRMHQAVLNLIKNALESIVGQGKIIISAHADGAHHAVVRIEDTGVGIPTKDLERVFEFEFTTKEKGLGLGLPMAREIIQAHGGDIKVESEPGKGTTLEIILPRKDK